MNKILKKTALGIASAVVIYLIYHFMNCPIKYFTGVNCAGCGFTRATLALLRLDFKQAFYYHPLVFLVIPMGIYFVNCAVCFVQKKPLPQIKNRKLEIALIIFLALIFTVVWIIRLTSDCEIVTAEFSSAVIVRLLRLIF